MTARKNSTQEKAEIKANNERWEASKNGVTIRVYEDGTVGFGSGESMTWAEAHDLITNGRKQHQAERKDRNGLKKAERVAAKRTKLEARAAGIAAALEALGADPAAVTA